MSDPGTPVAPSPVLGDKIAALRQAAALTQPELAIRAGVSVSTVYRAEQSDPSVGPTTVARLAGALSVESSEIYAGDVLPRATQPVSANRAEEQHEEVIGRLDAIQTGIDQVNSR